MGLLVDGYLQDVQMSFLMSTKHYVHVFHGFYKLVKETDRLPRWRELLDNVFMFHMKKTLRNKSS